jgi:hypothetical protein
MTNSILIKKFSATFKMNEDLATYAIDFLCKKFNRTVAQIVANIISVKTMWNNFRDLYNTSVNVAFDIIESK